MVFEGRTGGRKRGTEKIERSLAGKGGRGVKGETLTLHVSRVWRRTCLSGVIHLSKLSIQANEAHAWAHLDEASKVEHSVVLDL